VGGDALQALAIAAERETASRKLPSGDRPGGLPPPALAEGVCSNRWNLAGGPQHGRHAFRDVVMDLELADDGDDLQAIDAAFDAAVLWIDFGAHDAALDRLARLIQSVEWYEDSGVHAKLRVPLCIIERRAPREPDDYGAGARGRHGPVALPFAAHCGNLRQLVENRFETSARFDLGDGGPEAVTIDAALRWTVGQTWAAARLKLVTRRAAARRSARRMIGRWSSRWRRFKARRTIIAVAASGRAAFLLALLLAIVAGVVFGAQMQQSREAARREKQSAMLDRILDDAWAGRIDEAHSRLAEAVAAGGCTAQIARWHMDDRAQRELRLAQRGQPTSAGSGSGAGTGGAQSWAVAAERYIRAARGFECEEVVGDPAGGELAAECLQAAATCEARDGAAAAAAPRFREAAEAYRRTAELYRRRLGPRSAATVTGDDELAARCERKAATCEAEAASWNAHQMPHGD
jgi:hypothetical protein